MKKMFGRAVYDTEKAEMVLKNVSGSYGDPSGYEEILFRTETGAYFIYGNGGPESAYPEEKITRISKDKVQAWMDAHQ